MHPVPNLHERQLINPVPIHRLSPADIISLTDAAQTASQADKYALQL